MFQTTNQVLVGLVKQSRHQTTLRLSCHIGAREIAREAVAKRFQRCLGDPLWVGGIPTLWLCQNHRKIIGKP